MAWILLLPFYWVIAKIFKFGNLKKDLCVVLNQFYNTDFFSHKDYIIISYLFNGFVIRHKKTKAILASGSYAWDGFLCITTDLKSSEFEPNIHPLKFDNSEMSEQIKILYAKGKVIQLDQTITISFVLNEPLRLSPRVIYKDIKLSKNRNLDTISLSLETYHAEDMYDNTIDYKEYPVSCYNINDLYLSYIIDQMKQNSIAVSILPELVSDCVCDYNDSKFTDRLILLDMVTF